jgi:hypothetical protein
MSAGGIEIPKPEEGWLYIDSIVLIKCLDPDGNIRYRECKSDGLHPVEALGMTETYSDTLRHILMRRVLRGGED